MTDQPCWEVDPRRPTFCAALSNGRKRCRKGTCYLLEIRQATLFELNQ